MIIMEKNNCTRQRWWYWYWYGSTESLNQMTEFAPYKPLGPAARRQLLSKRSENTVSCEDYEPPVWLIDDEAERMTMVDSDTSQFNRSKYSAKCSDKQSISPEITKQAPLVYFPIEVTGRTTQDDQNLLPYSVKNNCITFLPGYIPDNEEWFPKCITRSLKPHNQQQRRNIKESTPKVTDSLFYETTVQPSINQSLLAAKVNHMTEKVVSKQQRILEMEKQSSLSIKKKIHLRNLKNSLVRLEKKLGKAKDLYY